MMSSPGLVIVPLREGSDGDATHVPPPGAHSMVRQPMLYLQKIATQWMESRGEARPGVKYILERLPNGYTMWQRPRPGNPKQVDKYLYGHPRHKWFDSPNKFFPHFEYLMQNNGDNMGCPCTVCTGTARVLPTKSSASSSRAHSTSDGSRPASSGTSNPPASIAPSGQESPRMAQTAPAQALALPPAVTAPQLKGRAKLANPGLDTTHVDEEGTPDVYRNLIEQLRRHRIIDEPIVEPLSPDWRAEQDALPELLQYVLEKEQWIPRNGELVLYTRDLLEGMDFVRHEVSGELQLFNERTRELRTPTWEAGVVTQVPTTTSTTAQLFESKLNTANVIYAGVRIEPMPDPNSSDKSLSKRRKYATLQQIRPFVFWRELLNASDRGTRPTVDHALKVMSSMALVGRHRFKGTWPDASIYCHGVYLGSELLTVGDTARLLPRSSSSRLVCSDILVVRSIRLKLTGLDKASKDDYDSTPPYKSSVWIYGTAYTSDPSRSNNQWLNGDNIGPPRAAADYGAWYPLHPPTKELAVPLPRILGRLYERDAVAFFLTLSAEEEPDLDAGRAGLTEARVYSRAHDDRITSKGGVAWFWGDSRAEVLGLHTINGIETSQHDLARDMKDVHKRIKIAEVMGRDGHKPSSSSDAPNDRGLRRFMAPTLPTRSREASGTTRETGPGGWSTDGRGQKRDHVADSARDDEFQESTRIIEEESGAMKKKARVMVVIDD